MTLFEEIRHFVARLLDILQFTGSWTETIINVTLLVTTLYTIFFLDVGSPAGTETNAVKK